MPEATHTKLGNQKMTAHRLSFKGLDQEALIEVHRQMRFIRAHITGPATPALLRALCDIVHEFAGDLLESKAMSEDTLRQLFYDMRTVTWRRKLRPKASALHTNFLAALGRRAAPASLAEIAAELHVPRTSVESVAAACLRKQLVVRELRGSTGYYSVACRAEAPSPPAIQVGAGALVSNPRIVDTRRSKQPFARLKSNPW